MIHDEQLEPEQIQAFEKAVDILKDHFPTFVILAQTMIDDGGEICRHSYVGSHSIALGMLEQYRHILKTKQA